MKRIFFIGVLGLSMITYSVNYAQEAQSDLLATPIEIADKKDIAFKKTILRIITLAVSSAYIGSLWMKLSMHE